MHVIHECGLAHPMGLGMEWCGVDCMLLLDLAYDEDHA